MNTHPVTLLENKEKRQYAVAWALRFAQNTSLDPSPYERALLNRFIEGSLTIDQVLEQLDQPVSKV
ncbi:antitoxin VbhA family protein [uncultured Hymenobacter sp.]|uniref:antitoxin VbhA family protein n=1 Tax=uncultured Hymenobacter sp. TaxID=170016 RepID=UPI0035CA9D21